MDVFWGWLFVLPLFAVAIKDAVSKLHGQKKELLISNPRFIIVLACESLWCLRLSFYIAMRHTVEDFRFKELRDKFSVNGPFCMHINFIFKLFVP